MRELGGSGRQPSGRGARLARLLLIAGIHLALVVVLLEVTVPPAFEGDSRPLYVRLVEGPPPARVEPPPAPPKETPPPRSPKPALLAAATEAPAAAAFTVPPQPAAPPPAPATVPAPPALVEARVDANYLDNPKPVYPSLSRRLGEQGTVSLRVHVGENGTALAVEVAQSSRYPALDEAARQAVSRWRFVAARRGDRAVDSWVVVPVTFQLQ